MPTKIEWTDETWNPVTGCTKVSEGCRNCYAERMARRLAGRYGYPARPNHFDVTLHPERLEQPMRWRKPRKVFVCSMGDLFHEDVPFEFISKVFEVIERTASHTYQLLTKRPQRMLEFANWMHCEYGSDPDVGLSWDWPENAWAGVTVENQAATWRIDELMQTPAAVRFVSFEPLLDDVAAGLEQSKLSERIDWAIVGGESGPGARPMHPDWARALREWALCWGIPFFFKQWGGWVPNEIGCGDNYHFNSRHICINMTGEVFDSWPKAYRESHWDEHCYQRIAIMAKASKKAAGRLLDGCEWNETPEVLDD